MSMLTLEVAEVVASTLEGDSSHMGLQVVVCTHCWLLRMSGVEETKIGWYLRLHAQATRRLLLV
jgi:hypothetical protein